jgi:hypothetical protein
MIGRGVKIVDKSAGAGHLKEVLTRIALGLSQSGIPGGTIVTAQEVRWGELGCPTKMGLYRFAGEAIRVKSIHIAVAENDPVALFTVVALRPPMGPAEFMLGHRVA